MPEKDRINKGYTLLVGNKTEDGKNFYVRLKDNHNVYLMAKDTLESMLTVDAYTYMDHSIYSSLATDINGYDVTIGNQTISVTRTATGEKNSAGKETIPGRSMAKKYRTTRKKISFLRTPKLTFLSFPHLRKRRETGK